MLWGFIYLHSHIYFYLIIISLPLYLLNKHTVKHIVSKELCVGRGCKSWHCSPTWYLPAGTKTVITQRVFSQQMRRAGLMLIAEEEQPWPSCPSAISASPCGISPEQTFGQSMSLESLESGCLSWLRLPWTGFRATQLLSWAEKAEQLHAFCSPLQA